jgi:hypothetical protein
VEARSQVLGPVAGPGAERVFAWASWVLLVSAMLDAVTTQVLLATPGSREANPIAESIIRAFGLPAATALRAGMGLSYFWLLRWVFRTQTRATLRAGAWAVALIAAAWWWVVAVNNVVLISR